MAHRLIFSFLILFFFLRQATNAQDSDLIFKNITTADGLSQSIVLDIAQDSLGFMWFATPEALNRYDGSEFKIFAKSFDYSTDPQNFKLGKLSLFQNELWMITKGGKLEVFNLQNESFSLVSHFGNSEKLIPELRSILIENENQIWLGTEGSGLYVVDGEMKLLKHYSKDASRTFQLISNKINHIFKDSRGDFWISTDNGINKIEENHVFTHLEGIYSNIIIEDPTARLIVGTQKNGVYLTDLKHEMLIPLSGSNKRINFPPDVTVLSLHFDLELRLWIGTYGDGLYILNNRAYAISQYLPVRNKNNSIGFKGLLSIFSDGDGGVWVGTDGGGVSFFDESSKSISALIQDNSIQEVPMDQVTAIATGIDSSVWYGTTGSGFVKFHPGTKNAQAFSLKNFINNQGNSANPDRISALSLDASGDLWIASEGSGTFIFDTKNLKLRNWLNLDATTDTSFLPDNSLNCFLVENDTTLWAGAPTGLYLINKDKGLLKKYKDSNQDEILSLARINDYTLAVGFKKSGLAQFNILSGEFTAIAADFIAENLDQIQFNSLFFINDWLWASTEGRGLLASNLKTGKSKLFTKNEGLPSDLVYGILPEDSRKIWVSCSLGLFKLIFNKQGDDLDIESIILYDQKNGFSGNEFKAGAYHKDVMGTLYFGGVKGINFIRPDQIEERRSISKVVISDLKIGNRPFLGEKSIAYTKHFELEYSQNSLEFKYTTLNFLFQENYNYSYMLAGYDNTWIDAGTRKYAAYTNLEPGQYDFKVRLTNNSQENDSITSVSFSIATPYWKQAWFKIFVVLMVVGTLYLIYRIRIIQLLEVQIVKQNISAELHDDLGARLTTLQLISAISKPKFEDNQKVKGLLESIDNEISASTEALDEIVWNIQANDESLNEVTANIRRYVSELFENYGLEYSITVLEDFGRLEMKMQKRREVFLICKELTNNIRKHAAATKVEMHLGLDNEMFFIGISDNGKGFDPEQETKRNGLANIKRRVKKWKGKITISSEMKGGSRFEIWIPFDQKNLFKKLLEMGTLQILKYPQKWGL